MCEVSRIHHCILIINYSVAAEINWSR